MSGAESAAPQRYDAIDSIKALAIVAVVFTHSVLGPERGLHTPYDDLLGRGWVSFHVPAFLAVSGFLYYSETKIPWPKVLERLARVLLPYLVASFVALLLGAVPDKAPSFWLRLVSGNTQGHYYYVALITAYIPLIWLMSRMRPSSIWLVFALLVLYPLLAYHYKPLRFAETHVIRMRNPIYPAVYFAGGWVLHMAAPQLRRLAQRVGLAQFWSAWAALGVAGVAFYFYGPWLGKNWQVYLADRMIYTAAVIALVCAGTTALKSRLPPGRFPPDWIRFVSRATYTIYLYHFFFIYPMREFTLQWDPLLRIFSVAGAALLGGSLVAWLGPRILGPRSKWLLG